MSDVTFARRLTLAGYFLHSTIVGLDRRTRSGEAHLWMRVLRLWKPVAAIRSADAHPLVTRFNCARSSSGLRSRTA